MIMCRQQISQQLCSKQSSVRNYNKGNKMNRSKQSLSIGKLLFAVVISIITCNKVYAATILYGVTGDGATDPESLFSLDQTDGTKTSLVTLGNGDDGEAIAYNPNDGLIYHWSGWFDNVFESIDPDDGYSVTEIGVGGDWVNVKSATYNPSTSGFLLADGQTYFYSVSEFGDGEYLGDVVDGNTNIKGLAFVDSTLYGLLANASVGENELLVINPDTGGVLNSIDITMVGYDVYGGTGLATNPETGELWALIKVVGVTNPVLATIDLDTGVASYIGDPGDKFAGITFAQLSPVPLPPALVLFASGLIGLMVVTRKNIQR